MATQVPTRRQAMQMEGPVARWYVRTRNSAGQLAEFRRQAARLTEGLAGGDVLEVAPGPGFMAIELARLGRFRVTGLDMSHTMVELACAHARQAGVAIDFRQGDAAHMPLPDAGSTSSSARRPSRTSASRSAPWTRCIACCGRAGSP